MYIYIYIYTIYIYANGYFLYVKAIAKGMMESCRSIWEEGVVKRYNTRADEKKISEGGSIWEVWREYGVGNRAGAGRIYQ